MMELSEASTRLAPDSPPPELPDDAPPPDENPLPRAQAHLTPEEKALVMALLREFPNLDQMMAETIVLTNPAYDEVIEMENRAIRKLKSELREAKPEKDSVPPSVIVE